MYFFIRNTKLINLGETSVSFFCVQVFFAKNSVDGTLLGALRPRRLAFPAVFFIISFALRFGIYIYWDEYIPVTGTGQIQIVEDNTDMTDAGITQHQRLDHINELLSRTNLKVYRRHIASSL